MKILSRYKDYYDYLSGIYGVDDKIILDRREHKQHEFFNSSENECWSLLVCSKRIDFVYHKGEFIYLQDLLKKYKVYKSWSFRWDKKSDTKRVTVGDNILYTEIIDDFLDINKKENCPIILCSIIDRYGGSYNNVYKFPKLSDLQFNKVMKAEDIYLLLSEYLSPKDIETKELTNKEKIVSHGYDLKTSFRGK